ncbi:N,N-dimethylformamidase beta subunit family domain-containing protein [Streptomyces abyssomicinicus]|uniref:N,N-dimethylformamidase beta subunit family domain-containing protein n=1 Tax=Streptomyces abyssomicinicus TaxID=574929 RepID=UPI001FE9F72E|nr:N,N-dimethylformamidase beta subunit family domain-containing protein [Streptomyces abyssomicinicus]
MTVTAYATSTSCPQGSPLRFRLDAPGPVPVTVTDATDGRQVLRSTATGPWWDLDVPADWTSSLYTARFGDLPATTRPRELPGTPEPADHEVWFVVREAVPTAPVLVSVPFTTWQAYNRAGEPGQGLYWTEAPTRARRVTFDRPGGGPPPERWEEGLMRWLRTAGYQVAYCSNLDLHDGRDLLAGHRLLIVNGHDEYWSADMRDAVEEFVRDGGNAAFFSGNTAWWQIRLEDRARTMVCHRDALGDPEPDPALSTVEWSATGRPENSLTGLSFRAGAGIWGPHMARMLDEAYTARFAAHWVFEGTGLGDGDKFGQGTLGYETDAAEYRDILGVPRVTCHDGTPPSFVVLATADLAHWSAHGQGGMATMGVFTNGAGTVFNAATVNWGHALDDPVVDRITRNVLDRLSTAPPEWEVIGDAAGLRTLAAQGRTLHGVSHDDRLLSRELCGQNLPWQPTGPGGGVVALAAPREAAGDVAGCLHGVTADGRLRRLDHDGWHDLCPAPRDAIGLAVADCAFHLLTASGELWTRPFAPPGVWERTAAGIPARGLAAANGRLFALHPDGTLLSRLPTDPHWTPFAEAPAVRAFTAHAGWLITSGDDELLRRRPVRRPPRPR